MAVIAFAHHKGGTGKTTSCIQTAGFLVKSGRRVLVVDTDPQANATLGLGIHPGTPARTIYNLYMSRAGQGDKDITLSDLIIRTVSGIDLVPSHLDLIGAEPALYEVPDRYEILSHGIESIKTRYDHILIDTPPFLGQFVLNGIIAADRTFLVFSPDTFAMNGYENIRLLFSDIEEILGKRVTIDTAILNRWDRAKKTGKISARIESFMERFRSPKQGTGEDPRIQIEEQIRREMDRVFLVPESSRVGISQRNGIPLAFTSPGDPAAEEFSRIAESVDKR